MTLAAITMTAPEAASPVQMYRATYSPDDNKLRLYAASRLDPETYKKVHDAGYGIRSVPALVVFCSQGHDIIRGNLRVRQALEKVAATGDCRQVAQGLLDGTGDKSQ